MAAPPVIEITSSPAKAASESHRLPTVSASQALFDLQDNSASYLSTGLPALDFRLADSARGTTGGIERGKITEIWGPSGSGKTALALQIAGNVVKNGGSVLWIDGASELSGSRWRSVISAAPTEHLQDSESDKSGGFNRVSVSTLSHLLALTVHTPQGLINERTSLLVIDDLHILLDLDYPRQQISNAAKTEQQKWQASRRYAILGSLVSSLNKLAVLNNLAIIATTGCSTRMRPDNGLGSALVPGIGGAEWDAGIWNRLVLFRDFGGRFVGVQKSQGKSHISREEIGETGRIIGFDVASTGAIQERQIGRSADVATAAFAKTRISPVMPRKRAFGEIADSDGEDVDEYGWAEADDDAIAAEGLIDDGRAAESTSEP